MILWGQDPFPSKADAHGLSFSSLAAKIPPSTVNIFKCLKHHNLIDSEPPDGDLTEWAKQGILLLNYYFTRTPNIKKKIIDDKIYCTIEGNGGSEDSCMHKFWSEFSNAFMEYYTSKFIAKMINNTDRTIYIVLWGSKAAAIKPFIKCEYPSRCNIKILTWGHPSPLNRANQDINDKDNFIYCDHFRQISREYPKINWDPSKKTMENLRDQFWSLRQKIDTSSGANITPYVQEIIHKKRFIYDDLTNTNENNMIKEFIKSQKLLRPPESQPESQVDQQQPESQPESQPNQPSRIIAVYIDGGCRGNHIAKNTNSVGGSGVYFAPKWQDKYTIGQHSISEKLHPNIYLYDTTNKKLTLGQEQNCTNQRAELLAVVLMLQKIIDLGGFTVVDEINIITDSKQYVMSWLNGRLWSEYKKDKKFTKVVNRDLVILICRFWWMLAKTKKPEYQFEDTIELLDNSIKIIHINSHLSSAQKNKLISVNPDDEEKIYGNEMADKLCNDAIDLFHSVI
jgi:uracil DNA glycosylase/ribonuclease HI